MAPKSSFMYHTNPRLLRHFLKAIQNGWPGIRILVKVSLSVHTFIQHPISLIPCCIMVSEKLILKMQIQYVAMVNILYMTLHPCNVYSTIWVFLFSWFVHIYHYHHLSLPSSMPMSFKKWSNQRCRHCTSRY